MGVESSNCFSVGELLGVRTISVGGVAYINLATLVTNNQQFETYTSVYNNTWSYRGKDIYLQHWNTTLEGGILSVSYNIGISVCNNTLSYSELQACNVMDLFQSSE